MGRGDKKSKKGKLIKGSYGNSRRRKPVKTTEGASATPQPPAAKTKK